MKRTKTLVALLLLVSLMMACFAGCGKAPTFGEWTDNEVFQNIPAMVVEGTHIGAVEDYGDKNYQVAISGTSLSDYQDYLKLLDRKGYDKYVDNGENGINGTVYTTTLTKDTLGIVVTHMVNLNKTYVSAKDGLTLSPHVFEENADKTTLPDAKTTMYNLQCDGNAYLIQLKNGHFIMNDGGSAYCMENIVSLMEELAPAGEKPTVDAWFYTHEHGDHAYGIKQFARDAFMADRVNVEAIYYSEISQATAATLYAATNDVGTISTYIAAMKTSEGEIPTLYRPRAGERYYFNDVVVEVPYTQEQCPVEEYEGDLNGSSLWLMYYIDGQKFMLNGDTERNNVNGAAAMYDQEYFDVDIMSVFHHGHNIHAGTETYFNAEVLTYPSWGVYNTRWGPLAIHANNIMMNAAEEAVSYLNGSVKYTFPYEVGTYEIMENWYPEMTAEQNEANGEYAANTKEERTFLETGKE